MEIRQPFSLGSNDYVSQIIAGTNITISPTNGEGVVTINATGGGGTPASPNKSVQFNNSGAFGGSANLEFDSSIDVLSLNSTNGNPDYDQFSIKANDLGALNLLNWGPGDQEIHFDVEWTGGQYIARNTTVSSIWAINQGLQFYSQNGNTLNGVATLGDPIVVMTSDAKRTGFQVPNPLNTIHASAVYGDTIAPPTSLSITKTIDPNIDHPGFASASQISSPTIPNSLTLGFTYIDTPIDAGWFANQDIFESGFIANGQTITYNLYGARYVDGVTVINPNPFSSITFTDTINDGTTPFGVDIGGWGAPNGYVDTYYISRTDSSTGFTEWTDIGNTTAYSDVGFTGSNLSVASQYPSSGGNATTQVAQYSTISGIKYRSDYATNPTADGNISGTYYIVNASWGALVNSGFIAATTGGQHYDVLTATTFNDYGQSVGAISDYTTFSTIAFPYFDNSSLTPASSVTPDPINYGGGGFTADGSTWSIEVWDYKTNSLNNVKYFVSSPVSASNGGDDSSFNPMYFTGTLTPGSGNGAIVKLLQNGTVVAYADIGGGSTWNISTPNGDISTSTSLSGYTGIFRQFNAYGFVTSPTTKYSLFNTAYTFTDNNPLGGYVIQHNWSTPGSASDYKVLETSYRGPGYIYSGTAVTSFIEINTGLGDSTITPNTIGYPGDGSTYTYDIFTYNSVSNIYSSTGLSGSITLPVDSNFYLIDLTFTGATGATAYKGRRTINAGAYAYWTFSGSPFEDNTGIPWNDNSTLTPTQLLRGTARFDSARSSITSEAQINAVALGSSTRYAGIAFGFASVSTDQPNYIASINVNSANGDFTVNGNDILQYNGVNHINTLGLTTTFNEGGVTYYQLNIKGTGADLLRADASLNTIFAGNLSYNYDPTASLSIQPNGSDKALLIYPNSGVSATTVVFGVENSSATDLFQIDASGNVGIGKARSTAARLIIAPANNQESQVNLTLSNSSIPSSPISGDMWYTDLTTPTTTDGGLYFRDKTSTKRVQMSLPSFGGGEFWYTDGFGNATILNAPLNFIGGIVQTSSTVLFQATNGMSVSSGKDISMGTNSRYLGGVRYSLATTAASVTLNQANNSPWTEFTGSTASRTLTLPTAASVGGVIYNQFNRASVSVTVATTSSQNMNYGTGTVTSVVMQPGDMLSNIATGSTTWNTFLHQYIKTVDRGGTNITSYAVGDLLYASGTTTLSKLADVATGNALISGGVTTAPSWGKIGLTTHVSGTLPVANGGTGQTTPVVVAGSVSTTGTATTTFTVTIGATQANTTYKVNVTPTSLVAAAVFYVNNKTTTTFDVVYLAGLTGAVSFDWSLFT